MFKSSLRNRVAVIIFVIMLLLIFSINPGKAATGINNVTISDVGGVAYTVSWATTVNSNGSVTWGTSTPPGNTINDSVPSTTTHYIRITGLSPNTHYYFQVTSGDETDNNSGAYYQVTTGPSLSPGTPSNTIWGYMYQSNGITIVPNAMVYLQLQDVNGLDSPGLSQVVTVRTDSAGVWSYALVNNVRTSDYQSMFIYTPGTDHLRIKGQGGMFGTIGLAEGAPWIIDTPNVPLYQQNIILSEAPTDVMVSSFTGKAMINDVQLEWKTVSEVELAGFNVYRSESQAGAKQKLNSDLITAQNPGQMIGASYHFGDSVQQGQHYYYWLELVITDGNHFIEPIVVDTSYWNLLPAIRLGS
jgi:hypothetical protein